MVEGRRKGGYRDIYRLITCFMCQNILNLHGCQYRSESMAVTTGLFIPNKVHTSTNGRRRKHECHETEKKYRWMQTGYCQIQINKYQQVQNEYAVDAERVQTCRNRVTTGIKSSMDVPVPMQNMYKKIQRTKRLNIKTYLNKMTTYRQRT